MEVDHGDGLPKTSMKFVRSHGEMEAEFTGALKDVDNVCVNLAGQFAAAATYQHIYERELSKTKGLMQREFTEKFKELEEAYKKIIEDLEHKLFGSQSKQEGSADESEPVYYG